MPTSPGISRPDTFGRPDRGRPANTPAAFVPGVSIDTDVERLGRLAARVLGASAAVVCFAREDDAHLLGDVAGVEWCARLASAAAWRTLHSELADSGTAIIAADLQQRPRTVGLTPDSGPVAYVGLPLVLGNGRVAASLAVVCGRVREWSPEDLEALSSLGLAMAAAIELRAARLAVAARDNEIGDLLANVEELVCTTGRDGRITFANAAWRRTLGYAPDEIARLRPMDLVVPEHRARYAETARRLIAGEPIRDFEAVLLGRDGRRIVCRGWAEPRMENGVCIGTQAGYRDMTAEHHADAVRARLAATLEVSPDFVALIERDGRLRYLNAAGRQLVGLPEGADLDALIFTDLNSPEESERFLHEISPAAQSAGVWRGDAVLLGACGEPVPVSQVIVAHPSTRPGEAPFFLNIVARDLRPRLKQESALQRSQARFRAALDASLDAFFVMHAVPDANGVLADLAIVEVNARGGELFDMPHEDVAGHLIGELFPVLRFNGLLGQMLAVVENGQSFEREVLSVDPRLAGKWLWLQAVPVYEHGVAVGIAFTVRDISERKRAEAVLAAEREFLGALLDNLAEGVIACDAAGRPTLVNQAARTLLGVSATEPLLAIPVERIRRSSDPSVCLTIDELPLIRALHGEAVRGSEMTIVPAAGDPHLVLASGQPIVGERGERLGAVVVWRDVTIERQAAELRDQLIATASHELRTPITAITGALGLIARSASSLPDRERGLLDIATRNAARLTRLANDLLDIERIEAGTATLHPRAISAHSLLTTAGELMQSAAEQAQVRLEIRPPSLTRAGRAAAPLIAWADPDRASQVLVNLLGNAIKFSSAGGTVRVAVERDPGGGELRFTVRDEGCGIPPEHLDSIFERFTQVRRTDASVKGGAGLGLAICRTIVKQHGGRIWAESTLDEGSCFSFTLPMGSGTGKQIAVKGERRTRE